MIGCVDFIRNESSVLKQGHGGASLGGPRPGSCQRLSPPQPCGPSACSLCSSRLRRRSGLPARLRTGWGQRGHCPQELALDWSRGIVPAVLYQPCLASPSGVSFCQTGGSRKRVWCGVVQRISTAHHMRTCPSRDALPAPTCVQKRKPTCGNAWAPGTWGGDWESKLWVPL